MYKYHFINMNNEKLPRTMTTGKRIKFFRIKYSLTQEEFAEMCNVYANRYNTKVTQMDISGYENGKCCPKIDKLTAISKAMGVSIDYFCGYGATDRKSQNDLVEIRKLKKNRQNYLREEA